MYEREWKKVTQFRTIYCGGWRYERGEGREQGDQRQEAVRAGAAAAAGGKGEEWRRRGKCGVAD